jgi:hypothetical protein
MINAKQHERVLDNTLADIRAGVFDDLKALENKIAELVLSGVPASQIRGPLTQAFTETATVVKENAKAVTNISQDVQAQSSIQATAEDTMAEQALANQTEITIAKTVEGQIENVMETIVLGAAAGTATDLIARQVRGRISGVFMESTDPTVRRAQRVLRGLVGKPGVDPKEIASATRVIRDRLTGVNTTASLRDLTSKTVEATVMKFDGAFIAGKAERAGIERFEYAGGSIETSRPFCMDLDGETMTKDEIYELWDSSDWAGKEPGDPFVVRGGYNCRHFWIPVEED